MRGVNFVSVSLVCAVLLIGGAATIGHVRKKAAAEARQREADARAASLAKEAAERVRAEQNALAAQEAAVAKARADAARQQAEASRQFEADDQAKIASMRSQVAALLKDPGSAQFSNVRLVRGGMALCGQVNSKNSFGGYVGAKDFVVTGGQAYLREGQMELGYLVAAANSGC